MKELTSVWRCQSPAMTSFGHPSVRDLQTLLDAARACILYLNSWGVVLHANPAAHRWKFGSNLEDKSFMEFASNWDDPCERHREIMQVIRTGIAVLQSRERAVFQGAEYWFDVDKIPTRDTYGRVTGVMLVITDVTEAVAREKALRESEARYRAFISNSADGIWRYDFYPPIDIRLAVETQTKQILKRGVLVECNEKLAQLFGAGSVEGAVGSALYQRHHFSAKQDIRRFVESGYRIEDRELSRVGPLGEKSYIRSSAIGIVENGFLARAWGTSRDTTDQKRYLERMEHLANHDTLTSLPNRALLYRRIEEALASRIPGQRLALMLIDLDRFKEINDTLGHLAGDKVLKQLGPRLEEQLGSRAGLVARLGGDEFAIFLPAIADEAEVLRLGHEFLTAICQTFELEGYRTEISASIGIALCPDQAKDVTTLMRYADVAMYHAKVRLKGVAVYRATFDSHSPKRLELMGALGRAIRENQLCLHFQPKVNLNTRTVYGLEALIRWNHPEMGFIAPDDFVSIAEMSSLIYPMTRWVLEETVKRCAKWVGDGYPLIVAMNLSARNVADDRILDDIPKILEKYQLPGEWLEMEITESMIMSDPSRAQTALEQIHQMGVKLSVDDFGTGYSSLAYLKRLPVQTLKIDGAFIQGMLEDDQDRIIVNSTINLAHNLGLDVVAECLDSREIFVQLCDLGCDNAQGFYIAPPMPPEDICEWLQESQWLQPCH